jgi:tetratricopeptide (TPR) repeat protein
MTLARSLLDSGDLSAARPEFEAVLKAAPDNILASRLLGECLESLGDLAGARTRYKTTLALAPVDKQLQSHLEAVEARLAAPAVPPPVEPPVPPPPMAPVTPQLVSEATSEPQFLDFEESPPAPVEEELKPIPLVAVDESFELEAAYESPATRVGVDSPASSAADAPMETAAPDPVIDQEFLDFEAESPRPAELIEVVARVPLVEAVQAPPPAAVEPELPKPALAPAPPAPVAELVSATLAELYSSQGHPDRAIEVYRQVLEREPANERARARLAELMAVAASPRESEASAAAESTPSTEARRAALWRTIRHLEGMLAAVRRG